MPERGKWAVLLILLVAVLATGGNMLYQRNRVHRSLELWGSEAARLAGQIESGATALLLAPHDERRTPPCEVVDVQGERFDFVLAKDAAVANGIRNIRQGLIDDRSFDWDAPPDDCQPQWIYGLRFESAGRRATFLFAVNCRRVYLVERGAHVSIGPTIEAFDGFLAEQFSGDPEREAPSKARRD